MNKELTILYYFAYYLQSHTYYILFCSSFTAKGTNALKMIPLSYIAKDDRDREENKSTDETEENDY